jgi:hypothetical protein
LKDTAAGWQVQNFFHAVNSVWADNSDHAIEGIANGGGLFEACYFGVVDQENCACQCREQSVISRLLKFLYLRVFMAGRLVVNILNGLISIDNVNRKFKSDKYGR